MIVDVERSRGRGAGEAVEAAEERGRVRASRLAEVLEPLELNALESESVFASSRSARST